MQSRIFAYCLLGLFLSFQNSYAATNTETPSQFINELGNDVVRILVNKNEAMSSRKASFRSEMRDHFDLSAIGKFIIARYWRRMSDEQKKMYLRLFEDAVVENNASQFDNYNNEKLIIIRQDQTKDGGYVVESRISRTSGGAPLQIEWKVFRTKRGLKVLDVIVNNVSMSLTLRNEYTAVINRDGIDGLLTYLKNKIAEDKAKQ